MSVMKPQNPDAARRVAAALLLGSTHQVAADAAGVSVRTVRSWIVSPWWSDMLDEARSLVHDDVEAFALKAVLDAVKDGDAQSARWVLERLRGEVWNPARKTEVDLRVSEMDPRVLLAQKLGRDSG